MAATPTALTPAPRQCAYDTWNTTTNCWNYRTCSNCLLTPGCMIGDAGKCEPLARATAQHNFTRAFSYNLTLPAAKDTMNDSMRRVTQEWEFAAFEATYCPVTDETCRQCIEEKFWMNGLFDSRFCVGADGCVCVSACEFSRLLPFCREELPSELDVTTPTKRVPTFEQGNNLNPWALP